VARITLARDAAECPPLAHPRNRIREEARRVG
jgi:hypothetical protein